MLASSWTLGNFCNFVVLSFLIFFRKCKFHRLFIVYKFSTVRMYEGPRLSFSLKDNGADWVLSFRFGRVWKNQKNSDSDLKISAGPRIEVDLKQKNKWIHVCKSQEISQETTSWKFVEIKSTEMLTHLQHRKGYFVCTLSVGGCVNHD